MSTRFINEFDRSADLVVNYNINELRDADHEDTILGQIGLGERYSLDSLVDGAGTDSLNFSSPMLPDYARNRARYCRSSGGAFDFDHTQFWLDLNALVHVLASFGEGGCVK